MLPTDLKPHFLAAIRRMLRPVVRQLIDYGIPYPSMAQLLKQLYVDVAERDFTLPFKRQTDSRLAVVTGLHRKDVAQLRRRSGDEHMAAVEETPAAHVIGRWMAGPPYATPDARALPLLYECVDERVPTFTRLVLSLGVDLPPRSVLDELLRIRAVELSADGTVTLREQAFIPPSGVEGKLTLLGSDPAELFATIMNNIEHADAPRLQRKVVYDNIGSTALTEVREHATELGEEFLRRANAWLASYDRDRVPDAPGGKRCRVALGVYYYEEEEPRVEDAPSQESRPPGRIRRSP